MPLCEHWVRTCVAITPQGVTIRNMFEWNL